jgi:glycosyltransferase involved in cell wall biosynthesis
MNTKYKPKVTVGIPAYNEEKSIEYSIKSVLKQKGNFILEQIVVACDGCSDNTVCIATKLSEKYPKIVVIDNKSRNGKTSRLNQIHKLSHSDYLMTLDADVVFKGVNVIDKLVKEMVSDPTLAVVSPKDIPVLQKGIIAKIIWFNHKLWDNVRFNFNNGNNIFNLRGASSLIRKDVYKHFKYPKNIVCDQNFLYLMSGYFGSFKLVKSVAIYYHPVANLTDLKNQSARTANERYALTSYFGKGALDAFEIPTNIKIKGLLISAISNPILTVCSIIMNVYLKSINTYDSSNALGLWVQTQSSKAAIKI